MISIPLFSPGNDTFPPAIQFAPVGISDPAFGFRSDLRYVPTLRTYLHYERTYAIIFFYSAGSEPRPEFDLQPKTKSDVNRGDFPPESRGFSPAVPGIFPRDCGDFPPKLWGFFADKMTNSLTVVEGQLGIFCRQNDKLAHSCGGPVAMKPMQTATLVLHNVRTMCWTPCDRRQPAECKCHFKFVLPMDTKIRCVPLYWTGSSSLLVSHVPVDSENVGQVWTAVAASADCLADSVDCLSESADCWMS